MIITSIKILTYYSIQHLQTAEYFTQRAARLERRIKKDIFNSSLNSVIQGYSASTLLTTVAFLEALANEIFADAHLPDGGNLRKLSESERQAICQIGDKQTFDKMKPLCKYNSILQAVNKNRISLGSNPGQDMSTVIKLRNELVHYKAELFDSGTTVRSGTFEQRKLLDKIKGRFEPIPGTNLNSSGWISAGCSEWAVKSAVAYTDRFFVELGIDPIYEHVRPKITKKFK